MNHIEFRWIETSASNDRYRYELSILIDGKDLKSSLKEWEDKLTSYKKIVGAYVGLPPYFLSDGTPEIQLLKGFPVEDYWEDRALIFVCDDCFIAGCWDMRAVVDVGAKSVVWREFKQPHRDKESFEYWDYTGFGPFEFEKGQYLTALEKAQELRPEE